MVSAAGGRLCRGPRLRLVEVIGRARRGSLAAKGARIIASLGSP